MSSALIVIDVQKCFLPGGNLATGNSRNKNISTPANTLAKGICNFIETNNPTSIFVTKDWHTSGHASFATNEFPVFTSRPGFYKDRDVVRPRSWKNPEQFDQTMWPSHCVQETDEANLDDQLINCLKDKTNVEYVLKGHEPDTDSYSAVANALGDFTPYMADINNKPLGNMPFIERLKQSDIKTVYITGIARNVCVLWTALDLLDFWILPDYEKKNNNHAYPDYKPIKLIFLYDLTRPVGSLPGLDISKEGILDKVLELITAKKINVPTVNFNKNNIMNRLKNFAAETNFIKQFFEISDSGLYRGGNRVRKPYSASGGKRKTRKRKTRRCCTKHSR